MCLVIAPPQAGRGSARLDEDSEVEVVYVREPTAEQAALAGKLLLPLTFFCYQNEPDYTSDDHTDGESNKMRISITSEESEYETFFFISSFSVLHLPLIILSFSHNDHHLMS